MTDGLRVWNENKELRLDTRDRTMRLTSTVYVAARALGAARTQTQFISLPGFDPAIDGAFLTGAEAGHLGYEPADLEDGFIPELAATTGGVTITWRGYPGSRSRTIRYMGIYIMVLRAE